MAIPSELIGFALIAVFVVLLAYACHRTNTGEGDWE